MSGICALSHVMCHDGSSLGGVAAAELSCAGLILILNAPAAVSQSSSLRVRKIKLKNELKTSLASLFKTRTMSHRTITMERKLSRVALLLAQGARPGALQPFS